jgi:hypothetical protein
MCGHLSPLAFIVGTDFRFLEPIGFLRLGRFRIIPNIIPTVEKVTLRL